ncbi:MAG: endoribonuclease MazF [Bacteriovoracaceae bacterium]
MAYIPDRGDIVWLNFTPQAGHEQKGKRPAIILSPKEYNKKTGLAVCCPITSNTKGYPFEVIVSGKKIDGVILSDHLKNLDWKARDIKYIEKSHIEVLNEVIEKISVLIIN